MTGYFLNQPPMECSATGYADNPHIVVFSEYELAVARDNELRTVTILIARPLDTVRRYG